MQSRASEFGAVAEIDFDEEATSSGYDAFADLVQMAVREDPTLASVASTSGMQSMAAIQSCISDQAFVCTHVQHHHDTLNSKSAMQSYHLTPQHGLCQIIA